MCDVWVVVSQPFDDQISKTVPNKTVNDDSYLAPLKSFDILALYKFDYYYYYYYYYYYVTTLIFHFLNIFFKLFIGILCLFIVYAPQVQLITSIKNVQWIRNW